MRYRITTLMLTSLLMSAVSACGGGGGGYGAGSGSSQPPVATTAPSAPPASVSFTSWSKQTAGVDERELPTEIDTVTFSFDGDQDPAAYDDLLPPAS